jgi:hypothetical protein
MHLVDKLLLVLLLLMLPLGVVASKHFFTGTSTETKPSEYEQLGETLQQIANKQQTPKEETSKIGISGVVASTQSGVLTVTGQAPSETMTVMVTATILPVAGSAPTQSSKSDDVLGQTVEIKAIKPKAGGTFSFQYPIEDIEGVVELRFEQGTSVTTVQYDVISGKQIPLAP